MTEIKNATSPVKVLSFVVTGVTWNLKCSGPEKSSTCTVSSPGRPAGTILSSTADSVVVRLGGGDWELKAPPTTPLSFANILIDGSDN